MTKITALVQKTFQGKPSGFTVTFDDGRSGNMEEKQSDKGLRVGDEVIVTEIPYTSKAGKQSTLYGVRLGRQGSQTPPLYKAPQNTLQQPPLNPGDRLTALSNASLKASYRVELAKVVMTGVTAGKIEHKEVKEWFTEFCSMVDDSIDELLG